MNSVWCLFFRSGQRPRSQTASPTAPARTPSRSACRGPRLWSVLRAKAPPCRAPPCPQPTAPSAPTTSPTASPTLYRRPFMAHPRGQTPAAPPSTPQRGPAWPTPSSLPRPPPVTACLQSARPSRCSHCSSALTRLVSTQQIK